MDTFWKRLARGSHRLSESLQDPGFVAFLFGCALPVGTVLASDFILHCVCLRLRLAHTGRRQEAGDLDLLGPESHWRSGHRQNPRNSSRR